MKFVILDHLPPDPLPVSDARSKQRHFDLMFEVPNNKKLTSFALLALPEEGQAVDCVRLADHRIDYLSYEGPVSNNRGVVEQFAIGHWSGELESDVTLTFGEDSKTFAAQVWKIRIESARLFRRA